MQAAQCSLFETEGPNHDSTAVALQVLPVAVLAVSLIVRKLSSTASPIMASMKSTMKMSSSVWLANAGINLPRPTAATYPKLQPPAEEHYDAVVVGGGIIGCTAAYMLKCSGKRVALVEAREIGTGTTGFSTAKLSAQQSTAISTISQQRGQDIARLYYDMNISGLRMIEDLVNKLKLDCEYEPRSHIFWTSDPKAVSTIETEYNTCKSLGIDCKLIDAVDLIQELPISLHPQLAVCFENQAQFNSYKFCTELCKHIPGDGSAVFEGSRVTKVSQHPLQPRKPHDVYLEENGCKVSTDYVVLATHLPIMNQSLHFAVLQPSRSYCMAVRVNNPTMKNMFINSDMPKRSLRMTGPNDDILVISGESVSQGDTSDTEPFYERLETWAREHYDVKEVVGRWSAMDFYSGDHVPFVGYLSRQTNTIFTATGMSKWGLAMGVASSALITDLINGKENKFHDMVDARRWDLSVQFKGISMENWHTAKHLVGDKLKQIVTTKSIKDLQPGEGGVVKAGLKTVGAYRDEEGSYHVVDHVCTHLGCNCIFNNADKCWDCPCHGSQFAVDGDVIQGPATKPLPQLKDLQW